MNIPGSMGMRGTAGKQKFGADQGKMAQTRPIGWKAEAGARLAGCLRQRYKN
jgi:hypothetical protein